MAKATVELRAHVDEDLHRRFIQVLPGHGGVSWFMREAMQQFVLEAESNPHLRDLVANAVRRLGSL